LTRESPGSQHRGCDASFERRYFSFCSCCSPATGAGVLVADLLTACQAVAAKLEALPALLSKG
jgi:hypothetical protein